MFPNISPKIGGEAAQCNLLGVFRNLGGQPLTHQMNTNKNNLRLECNETYGDMWKIENERYHPIEYSYISDDIERETHLTTTYEETCMLYQARDLLNGEWQPKSI